VVARFEDEVSLVIVEAMVKNNSRRLVFRIFILTGEFSSDVFANSFDLGLKVDVVNHVEIKDLFSLILTKMSPKLLQYILRLHRKR
jgi:hypothetical protein